jgi:type IV pilus assembly protein PilY1
MKMKKVLGRNQKQWLIAGWIIVVLASFTTGTRGAEIELNDAPMYLVEGVPPNFFVVVDNSQNMMKAVISDGTEDADNIILTKYYPEQSAALKEIQSSRRIRSSTISKMAYNPSYTYLRPKYADGTEWPKVDFNHAFTDPFLPWVLPDVSEDTQLCSVNLETNYRPAAQYQGSHLSTISVWNTECDDDDVFNEFLRCNVNDDECEEIPGKYRTMEIPAEQPASYYILDFEKADCSVSGAVDNDDCYKRVNYGDVGFSTAEEKENFANWFSFHRFPILSMKTALSRLFGGLELDARIAHLSTSEYNITTDRLSALQNFTSETREQFVDWIYSLRVGKINDSNYLDVAYYQVAGLLGTEAPYRDIPDDSVIENNPERACRKNFQLMFVDAPASHRSGFRKYLSSLYITNNFDGTNLSLPSNEYGITQYSPEANNMEPYEDSNAGFFADSSFAFWARDLRPELANKVPASIINKTRDMDGDGDITNYDIFWNPENDPANWQHLTTYTISLGSETTLDPETEYDQMIREGFGGSYNVLTSSNIPEIFFEDDFWHAAVNSRGKYFNTINQESLQEAFEDVVSSVIRDSGPSSASAGSVNSGAITTDSKIYQARFDSSDWTGELIAYSIATGQEDSPCDKQIGELCAWVWEASVELEKITAASRAIFTLAEEDDTEGVIFVWDELTTGQKLALISDDEKADSALSDADRTTLARNRLTYLRGDATYAMQNGGPFRERLKKLGDIINSSPLYVGAPQRLFPDEFDADDSGSKNYSDFMAQQANRTKMVYVGANDGMLHAFDANTGVEKFAYVPNAVFPNLIKLTDPNYAHANYVDGPLSEGDVFFDGAWHSVLVGGMGLGAQGFYALDITNPESVTPSATQARKLALWEFTDKNDPDLGYTYGKPAIVRVQRSTDATSYWAAVVGNGYNNTAGYSSATGPTACTDILDGSANINTPCYDSASGDAVMYAINMGSGDFDKISTEWGSDRDPWFPDNVTARRPNGLAAPVVVDLDNDYIGDFAYAGDLHGNLWKFNLKTMEVAFTDGSNNPVPLFSAKNADGRAQPITQPVAVIRHPTGVGVLVLFGTGSYLGQSDAINTDVQTFYAIWDDGVTHEGSEANSVGFVRGDNSSLLKQEIVTTDTSSIAGVDMRIVSNWTINWETHKGWYIDLPESGERVHQATQVRDNRLIFLSLTPFDDPCAAGGNSWVMALDAADGSRLGDSAFDTNRDGYFGSGDLVTVTNADGSTETLPASGLRYDSAGIYSGPTALVLEGGETMDYVSTSGGDLIAIRGSSSLQWRVWKEIN